MAKNDSVNDRMVKWTTLPAVYLWLAASGSVVAMGILKPEVVLENLEGFIALIAIIGQTAAPAFATILELWKAEQQTETELHPTVINNKEDGMRLAAEHQRVMDLKKLEHDHALAAERQQVELGLKGPADAVLRPIKKKE